MIRQPAVAGSFYPSNGQSLIEDLKNYTEGGTSSLDCLGLVSPHAGYMYSGAIAGEVLKRVRIPNQVLLLGPNHHGLGANAGVFARGRWLTPLGEVPIAEDLAEHLLANDSVLEADDLSHQLEHSLEVQVPFLQYLNPEVQILPVSLGQGSLESWLELGTFIGTALQNWKDTVLILASSDMNHFADARKTRNLDLMAIEAMKSLDPEGLYRVVRSRGISMCGVIPAVVMLQASLVLEAQSCELVCYGHSGEVNGDMEKVVGYAGLTVQ